MPDNSNTIIFVPGVLSDEAVWSDIIDSLGPGFNCHVADMDKYDSVVEMARYILSSHEGSFSVVGHSMGARVALEMYRLAPQRINRMALLDTGIRPRAEGEEAKRKKSIRLAQECGMQVLADSWLPPMVHPKRHRDSELMGRLHAMVMRKTPEIYERHMQALLDRPDARNLLPHIECPVLLMVGRQDEWSPLHQHEEMLNLLPSAKLVAIEDAGHFAPMEQPSFVSTILVDWLGEAEHRVSKDISE